MVMLLDKRLVHPVVLSVTVAVNIPCPLTSTANVLVVAPVTGTPFRNHVNVPEGNGVAVMVVVKPGNRFVMGADMLTVGNAFTLSVEALDIAQAPFITTRYK